MEKKYFNYRNPNTLSQASEYLCSLIESTTREKRVEFLPNLVFLCIGTNKVSGDSLGPIVGSLLDKRNQNSHIYGTIQSPIHAKILKQSLEEIDSTFDENRTLVIAIDACLGEANQIGNISIRKGPLSPGAGIAKHFPSIGDVSIVGVVNSNKEPILSTLENTKISTVWSISEMIVNILYEGTRLFKERKFYEK